MKTSKIFKFIGFGILGIGGIILFIFITMSLWNWLVPVLFSGPIISFWQAAGLIILSKIIFSGIGHGGRSSHSKKRSYCGDGEQRPSREDWKKRFHEMKKKKEEAPTVE